jgi:hypothetical protein
VPQSSAAHLRKVLDDIATTSWLPNDPCFPVEHEDEPGAGLKQARMPLDLRTPQVADLVLQDPIGRHLTRPCAARHRASRSLGLRSRPARGPSLAAGGGFSANIAMTRARDHLHVVHPLSFY